MPTVETADGTDGCTYKFTIPNKHGEDLEHEVKLPVVQAAASDGDAVADLLSGSHETGYIVDLTSSHP